MEIKFCILSQTLLGIKELTVHEKLVFARMSGFSIFFESPIKTAEFLGISVDKVRKAKQKLEELGFITCVRENCYGKAYKAKTLAEIEEAYGQHKKALAAFENGEMGDLSDLEEKAVRSENKRVKTENKKTSVDVNPDSIEMAERLGKYITANFPYKKIDEKTITSWADSIGKIHRLDGRSWQEIAMIIDWCQKDKFWYKNILSGQKLRIQFGKLYDQAYSQAKDIADDICII